MEIFMQVEDGVKNIADILPLIISWYDDKFFHYNQMPEIANLQQSSKMTC
jgi:hypothetical protein